MQVETDCRDIAIYGPFMEQLGFCNPSTHLLTAFGTALLRPHAGGEVTMPEDVGEVELTASATAVTATLTGSGLRFDERVLGILLIDAATGRPVTLDYPFATTREAGDDGVIDRVTLSFEPGAVPSEVRAYLMVDTYPAARATLSVPGE